MQCGGFFFFCSPHLTSIWVLCCRNIGSALNVGEGTETETAALDQLILYFTKEEENGQTHHLTAMLIFQGYLRYRSYHSVTL